MQSSPEKYTIQWIHIPEKPSPVAGYRPTRSRSSRSNFAPSSSSPRPDQHTYRRSSSCNSRAVRGGRHEIPVPGNKLRRHRAADKEILRRALTPPVRRQSRRWWNFRPTPSRLCNMSMA